MQRVKEYTESYFLPAGECNPQQEMPVTLVARRIIDIATMHANLLDVGYARLVEDGLTWVLSRLSIEMYRYPGINESYSLSTWIEGFNRHFSERNFELTAESGEVLGHCRSVWVPINIRRRESGALEALESLSDVVSERRCPIDKQPRMTALGDEGTRSNDYRFRYCDCDFNRHVNAVRYMELYCLAEEPMEPQDGQRIMEAEALSLSLEDGLLEASLTSADGTEDTLRLSLRSETSTWIPLGIVRLSGEEAAS